MVSSHRVLPFLLSSSRASFGDFGKVRLQKGVEGAGVWSQIWGSHSGLLLDSCLFGGD